MHAWVRTAVLILAFATASIAGNDGGSAGTYPCRDHAPKEFVYLSCRDGARCDLDRTCDGWCSVEPLYRLSRRFEVDGYEYPCYYDVRVSGENLKHPKRWSSVTGTLFLRSSERFRDWLGATHVRVRCRPARRSCSPPPVTAGVVVSGDYDANFQTGAHVLLFPADFAADSPAGFFISLDDVEPAQFGLEQKLFVRVEAPLAPGTYQPSGIDVRFRDATGYHYFSTVITQCGVGTPCDEIGVFEGEVTVSTVEPTGTKVPVVHGYIRGTFSQDLDPQKPETITLDASF